MKLTSSAKYFLSFAILTLTFCLAVGFDISVYLRGPSPYPPEWRWPYFFVNTLSKIYLPLLSITLVIFLFSLYEKNKILSKHTKLFLFFLILLHFFFELSLLFFSRSGISVLIHRIINPTLNGYFTASLSIQNISDFLHNYNTNILDFIYHAKAHPPVIKQQLLRQDLLFLFCHLWVLSLCFMQQKYFTTQKLRCVRQYFFSLSRRFFFLFLLTTVSYSFFL